MSFANLIINTFEVGEQALDTEKAKEQRRASKFALLASCRPDQKDCKLQSWHLLQRPKRSKS